MEQIQHFSHTEHPLILVDINGDYDKTTPSVCNGCHQPMLLTSPESYRCSGGCHFFLHKRCAELPLVFYHHPSHPQHPLHLFPSSPYWKDGNCCCDACGRDDWKWFTYHCWRCDYDLDVICALQEDRNAAAFYEKNKCVFENTEIHQHPLTLQLKPASFYCDACGTEDEDLPYICSNSTCPFWIHKTCAHAPTTINLIHQHPDHPLTLAYSLPEMYHTFPFYCDICKKYVPLRNQWVYFCANCRFFSHVKCALNPTDQPSTGGDQVEDQEQIEPNADLLMHFPISDASIDLLSLHFKEINALRQADHDDDDMATTKIIKHCCHTDDHPLTLVDEAQGEKNIADINTTDDRIIVCDGCVRPISIPYYTCHQCKNFYLHKHCAELPSTLSDHPLHPDHPLQLDCFLDPHSFFRCEGCGVVGNKFLYKCDACEFYLDVGCAFLPNKIRHETHKHHPLSQIIGRNSLCNGCNRRFNYGLIMYECKACDFRLDIFCAVMLPRTVSHRYCKQHPIPLTYPPVKDHPSEFFCDICEEEIHPKYWLYYCDECDNSFHTYCIQRIDWYSNVKREGTRKFDHHKHPLTLVRRKKKSSRYLCSHCNLDINGRLIRECEACSFKLCLPCNHM